MRNGFNQFSIPYLNELTAGQYNAGSVFNGNTPIGFIRHSLGIASSLLQDKNPPITGSPDEFEDVIINGKVVKRRKRTQIEDIFKLPDRGQNPQSPPLIPDSERTNPANPIPDKREPGDENAPSALETIFGKSSLIPKQLLIVVIGLILLIAAIASFR